MKVAFEGRRELEGVGTVTQSVIVGAGWGVRRRGRITQEGVAEVDVDGIVVDLYVLNVSLVSVAAGGECWARSLAESCNHADSQ